MPNFLSIGEVASKFPKGSTVQVGSQIPTLIYPQDPQWTDEVRQFFGSDIRFEVLQHGTTPKNAGAILLNTSKWGATKDLWFSPNWVVGDLPALEPVVPPTEAKKTQTKEVGWGPALAAPFALFGLAIGQGFGKKALAKRAARKAAEQVKTKPAEQSQRRK